LGERLLCKQEVIGSIPFSSTSSCWSTSVERNEIENEIEGASLWLVLWLFDIVDRMQSTFGRKFERAWWR
jgi:hypothetical protein